MEKEGQERRLKEEYIPISKGEKNFNSIKQLYYFQNILELCNSDEDNVIYYIMEQTEREVDHDINGIILLLFLKFLIKITYIFQKDLMEECWINNTCHFD